MNNEQWSVRYNSAKMAANEFDAIFKLNKIEEVR